MPCGGVLREALKYDAVAALILYDEENKEGKARDLGSVDTARESSGRGVFWSFFDWIVKSSFEVCTDAFNTFRVCHISLRPSLFRVKADLRLCLGNPRPPQRNDSNLPRDQL
jgi:calcium binding protein 39